MRILLSKQEHDTPQVLHLPTVAQSSTGPALRVAAAVTVIVTAGSRRFVRFRAEVVGGSRRTVSDSSGAVPTKPN